ncbi:PorV/PorQ family protein [Gracilimonas sp.]|uniref:PorV/PorQ family protein n=1 Tax=Gracilimonas sp. TaxID=1974203 RepID=UPI0032ECF636
MKFIKALIKSCLLFLIGGLLYSQSALAQTSYGDDRAGTEGFQFAKISIDARSAAMGNSNMADAIDGSSLYWNPANASVLSSSNVMLNHTQYVADINLEYLSYIHKIGRFAVGGSIQYLNSGEINETTEFEPLGTGRTFNTHHISAGVTGSHQITDLFSYGITLRYLSENYVDITYQTGAIDFGFLYYVGETGLRFGVSLNNFGFEAPSSGKAEYETLDGIVREEPTSDLSLPTRFNIAAAYNVIENENHELLMTAQITNPSDNSEQLNVGIEYGFIGQFFIRSGYEFGIEERIWPSLGAGVEVPFMDKRLKADYGYTVFERLGGIHRIGLSVAL